MTEKITTERDYRKAGPYKELPTMELVAVIGRLKREAIAMQELGMPPPLPIGMMTDELLAAWKRRLPNTEPTDNHLSCFAIGIEVGRATDAQDAHLIAAAVRAGERARLRSIIMAKHEAAKGQHNLYHCLAVELFGY